MATLAVAGVVLTACGSTVHHDANVGTPPPPCRADQLAAAIHGSGDLVGTVDVTSFGCVGSYARATVAVGSGQASADFVASGGAWTVIFVGATDGANDGVPAPIRAQLAEDIASSPTATATTTTPTTSTTGSSTGSSTSSTTAPGGTTTTAAETPTTGLSATSVASSDSNTVVANGYNPSNLSDFTDYPNDLLHIIIATATGSGDGSNQRAFFFVGSTYLGTDTSAPSAEIALVGRTANTVTLSYALYAAGDPQSSPSGGTQNVTYELLEPHNRVVNLDPIPPLSARR